MPLFINKINNFIMLNMEHNKKILILDDEPDVITSIQYYLKNTGYITLGATNTNEAFDKISKELPDLIICDTFGIGTEIRMGRVYPDGYEFYQLIKENPVLYGRPKIIGMSSVPGLLEKWREGKYKADDVIKKSEIPEIAGLVQRIFTQ